MRSRTQRTRPPRPVMILVLALTFAAPALTIVAALPHAARAAEKSGAKLPADRVRLTVYRCPNDDFESKKAGVCPNDRQTLVRTSVIRTYKCESCGMTYRHGGMCEMGDGKLVAYDVTYECPADHKAVSAPGACPRCDLDAVEQLTKAPLATALKPVPGKKSAGAKS